MKNISELLNKTIEFASPPADLCLKCGKCCKMIISDLPRDKVLELAKNNDSAAKVFFNIFRPYNSIEDVKKIDEEHIQKVVENIKKKRNIDEKDITFYYCPHLSEENLCKVYSRRPECCKRAPANGWSFFPSGCGYEGWQFQEKEKHKQYVRQLKETLYELEVLYCSPNQTIDGVKVDELKQKIKHLLSKYKRFGVDLW